MNFDTFLEPLKLKTGPFVIPYETSFKCPSKVTHTELYPLTPELPTLVI